MTAEAVIGLEIHVQLRTMTKLFCADVATAAAEPNTQVCPACLGLPGALPALNRGAVALAVRAALGLGCTVHRTSVFERKSYFYPDLPKGYQITQSARPLATDGTFESVRIRRLHLEEDAGRLLHDRVAGSTAVDLNRAGVPLIEIVTEPDLRDAAAARAFLTRLRRALLHLEVSDCEMQNGSLRVDANVSVNAPGRAAAAVRTELKNLNSFAHVQHALEYEIDRQTRILEEGGTVEPETLLWDVSAGRTRRTRGKESDSDYRFHPDPDVPPLTITDAWVAEVRRNMPELPAAKAARFAAAYDLPPEDIEVLTAEPALASYFEAVAQRADAKAAAGWVMTEVLGWLHRHDSRIEGVSVDAEALADLIRLVEQGRVSRQAARRAFSIMAESGRPAAEVVAEHGLTQVRDESRIAEWVDRTLAGFPEEVASYRAGRTRIMAFFVGQIMKLSGGTADPQRSTALLRERLER